MRKPECKKPGRAAGTAAALLWILFGITLVIRGIAGDGGLLAAEMLRSAPPERTGLPEGEYPGVGRMTAEYLTGKTAEFQYVIPDGTGTACFQPHEAAHMADCRDLILLDTRVCLACGLTALALTAAGCARKAARKGFLRGILWGLRAAAVIAGSLVIWALADFDGFFVTFHRVAFRNEGWLLNSRTDLLIRLMPERFFIRLGVRGLLISALFPALLASGARTGLYLIKKRDMEQ